MRVLVCFRTSRALDVHYLYITVCEMWLDVLPGGALCSTRGLLCILIVLVRRRSQCMATDLLSFASYSNGLGRRSECRKVRLEGYCIPRP